MPWAIAVAIGAIPAQAFWKKLVSAGQHFRDPGFGFPMTQRCQARLIDHAQYAHFNGGMYFLALGPMKGKFGTRIAM